MTILITGIYGFIGSHLVKFLRQEYTIYGVDIIEMAMDGVEKSYRWDELRSIPPVDAIIHLAGKAGDVKNQRDTKEYFDVNTGLTQKIFDYFLDSKAKQFIFFSSVKAAADIVEGEFLSEEVTPKPIGPYGESKMLAENYILDTFSNFNSKVLSTKSVYILRACLIYGSGNKGNLNLLYKVIKRGIPYPFGAFDNRRSFVSIDNVLFVIEHLLSTKIESGIYNIADDETVSTSDLVRIISKGMNRPAIIWNWPPWIIKSLAKLGGILHLPINGGRLQKLTENYVVSNKKIKAALNIEKMPVSIHDGFNQISQSL